MGNRIDPANRRKAALLFEQGWGYKAVSSELGLKQQTARDWFYAWRAVGTERLCSCGETRTAYSKEVKRSAVRDRLCGIPTAEVMAHYGIPNRNILKRWVREYKQLGEGGAVCAVQDDAPKG